MRHDEVKEGDLCAHGATSRERVSRWNPWKEDVDGIRDSLAPPQLDVRVRDVENLEAHGTAVASSQKRCGEGCGRWFCGGASHRRVGGWGFCRGACVVVVVVAVSVIVPPSTRTDVRVLGIVKS